MPAIWDRAGALCIQSNIVPLHLVAAAARDDRDACLGVAADQVAWPVARYTGAWTADGVLLFAGLHSHAWPLIWHGASPINLDHDLVTCHSIADRLCGF